MSTARPRDIGLDECVSQRYMVFNWIQKHLRYTDLGQKVFYAKKFVSMAQKLVLTLETVLPKLKNSLKTQEMHFLHIFELTSDSLTTI